MSGGHWQYASHNIEHMASFTKDALDLLSRVEHTLDWGICADTCYECAKEITIEGIEAFFDNHYGDGDPDKPWTHIFNNKHECTHR